MSGSADAVFSASALRVVALEHFGGSADIVSTLSGGFVPVFRFSGAGHMVFGCTAERIIPIIWGAAIIIDFLDEPTYPMIVVTEAVEPIPTNTISVQAF